ncbi:GDSL-type esterase/lipase family protein [Roseobacter sp. WL0113]|uniref:GDSL-type esterase/lipase family protein n=2 Tax=Roseobacter sinensis TaxID=2931391 RepID=A0ABT3BHL9_9RHOB|nr:GDSL-type esterase/lipase family protein [Roseobacter sp. WL0113]
MRDPGDRRRHPRALRWPTVMAAALGPDWDVIAEGHPGRTAVFDDPIEGPHKNGQAALPVLLESHRPLDLVIVMLGTNDLKARFGQSAHDVVLGLQRLALDIARWDSGPGDAAPPVLMVAPACVKPAGVLAETFAGAQAKSAELPDLLCAAAARHGWYFTDVNAVAEVDPLDGVHLSAEAHAAVGVALGDTVLSIFND